MSAVVVSVSVHGLDESLRDLQRLRNAMANRGPMHAQLAIDMKRLTSEYLIKDDRHATAQKLGATPTGHRAKIGKSENTIEADSAETSAMIRIPRNTGLGRAFHDVIIRMRAKMLTIAACARTYGKSARDFPEGAFEFKVLELPLGKFPALVWKGTNDPAYWLARKTKQEKDPTLLPSAMAYAEAGRRSIKAYLVNVLRQLPV